MPDSEAIQVFGREGLSGTVLYPLPASKTEKARLQLNNGQIVEVPASLLTRRADGVYEIPLGPGDLAEPVSDASENQSSTNETVVPVLAEELDIQKQSVPTGGVRVHRRVLENDQTVEMPLRKEHVDVRRVVLNQRVDGPLPVRKEGDTTVIPIVEEVLIVQKQFVLKEEIRVTRSVREELHRQKVTVRRQEAELEHVDEHGRTAVQVPPRKPRRSILGE
jgi:uncharacterized protein (TIGR02271 family)